MCPWKKKPTELLGCPFCGNRPVLRETFGKLVVHCATKGCIGPDSYLRLDTTDLREVAAMWNRRPKKQTQDNPYQQAEETHPTTRPEGPE